MNQIQKLKWNVKKFPSDNINLTKMHFFLLRASTYHSFTFNSRFLFKMMHRIRLSKSVCGIFHFRFGFVFIEVFFYYFCKNKNRGLFVFKTS